MEHSTWDRWDMRVIDVDGQCVKERAGQTMMKAWGTVRRMVDVYPDLVCCACNLV